MYCTPVNTVLEHGKNRKKPLAYYFFLANIIIMNDRVDFTNNYSPSSTGSLAKERDIC